MIWHLYIACGWYRFRHADASSASAKSRSAVALPPRGPKSVAAAYIVACRRRGADGIVAIFWTGF